MVSQFWCMDYLGKARHYQLGSHWPARTDCRRENLGSCMARDTIHCPAAARASWEAPKHSTARPPDQYKDTPAAASAPCPPASASQGYGHSLHRTQVAAPGLTAESRTCGVCGHPAAQRLWPLAPQLSSEPAASMLSGQSPHPSFRLQTPRSGAAAVNSRQGTPPHMKRPMQLRPRFPGFNPT